MNDLERDVLAHLHANGRTGVPNLAAALGLQAPDVQAAVDALLDAGHLERHGDELVPDGASHPTPGLFIASERTDATSVEADYGDGER